ncbi:hypothetical protein [Thiolapillus sp.]|uniref:hypothetical protein n=1 Tax=Thiolapillus sp. TaxID=2017437 RepID=UPI0025CCD6CC|nr:hypothetical protein [Thiolapillus sp.]
MGVTSKPIIVSGIALPILLCGLAVKAAEPYPPVPGSYRPTSEYPGQVNTGNTQRFVPSGTRNPPPVYQPALPQPGYFPPPGYGSTPYTTPGFNLNPGKMMNNAFGTGTNSLPYGYPPQPLSGNVAPVYDPPLPATSPGWNSYGTQPAAPTYEQQPAAPTYTQQPAVTQPSHAQGVAPVTPPEYSSESGMSTPPAPQQQVRPTTRAPRPFSNPQTSGNAFLQRPTSPSLGRNDSRFRPPELKGTP